MKWNGIEVTQLTNEQLTEAHSKTIEMQTFRNTQIASKKERHNKFDLTNTNPAYEQLKEEIVKEIKDRGL